METRAVLNAIFGGFKASVRNFALWSSHVLDFSLIKCQRGALFLFPLSVFCLIYSSPDTASTFFLRKHTNKSAKTKHLSTWILIWCCIEYHGRYKLWRSRVSNIIYLVFFYQYTHVCFKKSHPQCAHNWQNLSFISHLLWVLLVSKFEAWSCKKNSLWSTRVCMLFSQAQHPCFFWILLTITTQLADQ